MADKVMTLPMATDTARCEAHFITDAAKRVAEQLIMVEESVRDGHARIRATQHYIEDLDRNGTIGHETARAILKLLLPPHEWC